MLTVSAPVQRYALLHPRSSHTENLLIATSFFEPPTAIKMCRYQDWEDDLPDSEVHDEYPGRDAVTAFIRQMEQQMNEISGVLDNMKDLIQVQCTSNGVCVRFYSCCEETPVVVDVLTCTIYLAALWHLSPL
ncbi:unnamed protein product [Prunus brigantina]